MITRRHSNRFVRWATPCICWLFLSACGTGTQPSAALSVSSISPTNGSTLGGDSVSIRGTAFDANLSVSIGGVTATDVKPASATLLTATTAAHAAGVVDVVVSSPSQRASLAGAFTYVAPGPSANRPPIITALTARGSRPNEPDQFADRGESITVAATVDTTGATDATIAYEWVSDAGGTFVGTGPSVQWQAPQNLQAPLTATISLTVTATYRGTSARPAIQQDRASATVAIAMHDSAKEVGDMARQFLLDFSDSTIRDVGYIMRNFSDSCAQGKSDESDQVANNRKNFQIVASSVGGAPVTVDFGGHCPFRFRSADACAQVPVDWTSIVLADSSRQHVAGTDQVTAVYERQNRRWALCESDFDGHELLTGQMRGFIR